MLNQIARNGKNRSFGKPGRNNHLSILGVCPKQIVGYLWAIIVFRQMRQQNMTHIRRFVRFEQVQRLLVGKVTVVAPNPAFQVVGVSAIFQQVIVVIGFQKRSMALAEMVDHIFAGAANVRKYAYPRTLMVDYEAVWV